MIESRSLSKKGDLNPMHNMRGEKHHNSDKKIYGFIDSDGNIFERTKWELVDEFSSLSPKLISEIISKRKQTHRGWACFYCVI